MCPALYLFEISPVWQKDRREEDPILVAGGPAMANPEPVVDFFDAFMIGDGEDMIIKFLRCVGEGRKAKLPRAQILENLSKIDGVYVPSLRPTVVNEFGDIVPAEPAKGSYQNTVRSVFGKGAFKGLHDAAFRRRKARLRSVRGVA